MNTHMGKHPSFGKPKPAKKGKPESHFEVHHYAGERGLHSGRVVANHRALKRGKGKERRTLSSLLCTCYIAVVSAIIVALVSIQFMRLLLWSVVVGYSFSIVAVAVDVFDTSILSFLCSGSEGTIVTPQKKANTLLLSNQFEAFSAEVCFCFPLAPFGFEKLFKFQHNF